MLTSDMDDMQLLELAAESIDYKLVWQTPYVSMGDFARVPNWNPLRNDWEAFRLAVALNLRINIDFDTDDKCVRVFLGERANAIETGEPLSATRRAIVRAAAELGLEKKGKSNEN